MASKKPRLLCRDIYSYVAHNTSLNRKQVQECFEGYSKLIMELIQSDLTDRELTIPLPQLGNFYFSKRKGKPNGSTYKMFAKRLEPKMEIRTYYNDPSYYVLKLRVARKVNLILKEVSKFYEHEE